MHWRRVIAASLELTAELLELIAAEVYKPPVTPPRERKPKTAKPSWYGNH